MIADKYGNIFKSFRAIATEQQLSEDYDSISIGLVLAVHDDGYLLINNRFRDQWELPGGFLEPGETPKRAAIREMHEETNIEISACSIFGVMQYFSSQRNRDEYGAIYETRIKNIDGFCPNAEAREACIWNGNGEISGYLNELDAKLIFLHACPAEISK